jgi:uncharacterized protein involved in exopolysaccharide biosynthesis
MKSQRHLTELAASWVPSGQGEPLAAGLEPAEDSTHDGLSLMQVAAILVSHWKESVIIAVLIAVVAGFAIKFLPKTFTAVATLIVNPQNADPLAAREFPPDMLANYVATQTELMLSPVILMPVVDRLKLTRSEDFAGGFSGTSQPALREYVEKSLSDKLSIEQGRGGQLLYVSASARDPVRAAEIANAVADVYIAEEQRRANSPAGERAQRYSEELAELRAKATAAEDSMVRFQKEHGLTNLNPTGPDGEQQALDNLTQQLLTAQAARRTLEAQTSGHQPSTADVTSSPVAQQLKAQLGAEQAQLAQLSTVYGPNHPNIREVQSQIDTTKRALETEVQEYSRNTSTQLSRARDLEARLTQAIAAQRATVLSERQVQQEGAKLVLERDSAQAVYKRALDGYDQILFAAVGNNTNVSIVARATPPVKPNKPNKIKLLLMSVVAGIAIGLVAPGLYELLLHRRVRCRDDIERGFAIPVLAEFGPIAKVRAA